MTYECTVNPDPISAFAATQGQLNVLLFVPYGLFATLATMRPLFAALTGLLFTAAIETAQATLPFVSRLCDSDDLITNAVGVLAGTTAGALIYRRTRSGEPVTRKASRRVVFAGLPIVILIGVTWATVIEPIQAVQPTEVPAASAAQARALNDALKKAFPATQQTNSALYIENGDGTAVVSAPLTGGFAEISWPDREQFTAHFTASYYGEGVHAYKIPGVSRSVRSAHGAKDIATKFASSYAPWAIPGSKVSVRPIDDKEDIGWVIEWRRWRDDILMPMRLDIAVEPSGRIIDLIARHIEDPNLPEAKIDSKRAWEIFEKHYKIKPGQGKRAEPIYLAERRDGQWRIHWRLSVRDGNTLRSATVDATDGSVHRISTEVVPEEELMP
ncbi:VanZ family protein [Streptomyces sp. NPDC052023]|uniref:VanZ family protein n=1 Tax=Streptomyces sp. NPDC052023 TaxID=3365681 RepID=UPI0037D12A39